MRRQNDETGIAHADDSIPDNSGAAPLPSGQLITTRAIPGAIFTNMTVNIPSLTNPVVGPDGAIQSALNPADGKTLVVMTSGYNTYDTATRRTRRHRCKTRIRWARPLRHPRLR